MLKRAARVCLRSESKDKVWGLWVLCLVALVVSAPFEAWLGRL